MTVAPPRVLLRIAVAFVAVTAVLGACGGDDSSQGAKADPATDAAAEVTLVDEPCKRVTLADLSAVTGIEFDAAEPSENACTYTSSEGLAAIALNFADIGDHSAQEALRSAQSSCDEGTLVELEFTDADGGFGCTVSGVATVAATGDGIFAVLTGATLAEGVETDQVLQDLATILEHSITSR